MGVALSKGAVAGVKSPSSLSLLENLGGVEQVGGLFVEARVEISDELRDSECIGSGTGLIS